ncbi:hypothetical protein BGZ96_003099 [Linnemannia gamsii]|uniref:Zinc finger PHD-type domain-containing protein n=1 Tax=Linnemannia gamsii TaxID=64522 RepID=A0ABQ7JJT5_9FUNG|nr:hypothetical protein BGZ96_003099 [Linnemannia gamsii]
MARGIPSSPKRSQRNGHTKSKKTPNKVDDDGGQTRCVCEQEHHMGVMIQCETCKVWQHCPCVGLGDGLVTPDKYYCDSCRPENHPYHVVDGVLMTNAENSSSAVASLKVKSPKTKSSARESKISTDRDSQPDTTAAEHINHGNVTRASKRRKKTDSTLDDLDQPSLHSNNNNSNNTDSSKNQTDDDESETTPAPVTTTKSHKKSPGSSSKGSKRKKGAVPEYELSPVTTSVVTNMTTLVPAQLQESLPIADQDSESATSASTSAAPSTRRNARSANNKKNSRAAPADDVIEPSHIVPASKRRRTVEQSTRSKEDSVLETEDEDKVSDKDNSPTEAVVEAPATRSSRKGHSTRANKKADPVDDEQAESTIPAEESPSASEDTSRGDSIVSHPEAVKRAGAIRKAQHNHGHHHHSRHGSPSGTPQPSQIISVQPTKIKFPSAKMTIADMNKRIKQLQDYVSHARAEMSEMTKNREAAAAAAVERANAAAIAASSTACEDSTMAMVENVAPSMSSDSQPAWLSTPPRSVHEPSRSESLDPMTQSSTSITGTAATSEQKQGGSSTQGGSRHGAGGQPPMTPPPQNEAGSCNTNTGNPNCDIVESKGKELAGTSTTSGSAPVGCLEQIDKLSHDLFRFQRRFGHKSDN